MEKAEISLHQVKIYRQLVASKQWMTNKELAAQTGVSLRNVAYHTKRFVDLGICDQAEVYPGHRYRFSDKANKRNASYVLRLKQADEVFRSLT